MATTAPRRTTSSLTGRTASSLVHSRCGWPGGGYCTHSDIVAAAVARYQRAVWSVGGRTRDSLPLGGGASRRILRRHAAQAPGPRARADSLLRRPPPAWSGPAAGWPRRSAPWSAARAGPARGRGRDLGVRVRSGRSGAWRCQASAVNRGVAVCRRPVGGSAASGRPRPRPCAPGPGPAAALHSTPSRVQPGPRARAPRRARPLPPTQIEPYGILPTGSGMAGPRCAGVTLSVRPVTCRRLCPTAVTLSLPFTTQSDSDSSELMAPGPAEYSV